MKERAWQRWTVLPILIFVGLVILLWHSLQFDPHKLESVLIGKQAPAFQLHDLFDEQHELTEALFRHQVSLLHVWATWCPTCLVEHDIWMKIAEQSPASLYGLDYKDERAKAKEYLAQQGNPYKAVLFDVKGSVAIDWGVYGTPETFVIDKQGVIRYKHVGMVTDELWHQEILPLIEELQA